jgi:tetratricopeptide (TPR) repeat protein
VSRGSEGSKMVSRGSEANCPKFSCQTFRALVIVASLICHWCPAGSAREQNPAGGASPRTQLSFADELFEQEEYGESALEYRRFLFYNPLSPLAAQAKYKLGLSYMGLERWAEAHMIFEQVVEKNEPREVVEAALFSNATCYTRQGMSDIARDLFRRVTLEFRQGELADDAQLMLALTYIDDENWLDAAAEFRTLAQEFPLSSMVPAAERLAIESAKGIHLPYRSVTTSGIASAVLPGAGQAWCGRTADGLFSLLFTGGFAALAIRSHHDGNRSATYLLGFLGLSFYMGNIYGAVNAAEQFNSRHVDRFQTRLRVEAATAIR